MKKNEDSLRLGLRKLAGGQLAEAKTLLAEAAGSESGTAAAEALALVEEVLSFRHSDLYNP
ncbi:MAG: hypothetical protein J1F06_05665 [Prevotellaceae bacterium]|nr:hypothetical protein [Prevotellaceae bacterium]